MWRVLSFGLCILSIASCTIHFQEEFKDETWKDRWVQSIKDEEKLGKFEWSAGPFYNDEEEDKGIQTSQDAKFYAISSKIEEAFSNEGTNLVIQFQVKFPQKIDCGGGYVKVFPEGFDQEQLHGETPYLIMFGPDICGVTKKVHVILAYKGKNNLINKEIKAKDDKLTHVYTLIIEPTNSYKVWIDGEEVDKGEIEEDWDILPAKKIKDPEAKKPEDWVDQAKIDDETDSKPEDWDKPQYIDDPDAQKPDDWDDELDGEWEAAQMDNPEYKGEWKPRQIDNPLYKGPWIHPEIDNPEYTPDDKLYLYSNIGGIGVDIWQVKSGTIFDNILITDDIEEASTYITETYQKLKDGESEMLKKIEEAEAKKLKEEQEKKEAEAKEEKAAAEENEEELIENVEEEIVDDIVDQNEKTEL